MQDKSNTSLLGADLPETEEIMFQLNRYPLLDEADGIEKAVNSKDNLIILLTMLVEESIPEEKYNLQVAHAALDWESIQKIAHKLKGGSLYCGVTRLRFACQYTERYLLAGHTRLSCRLYDQLISVLDDTQNHVKNWLLKNSDS